MLKENKKSKFKKSVLMGAMLLAPSVISAGQKVSNSNTSITVHADTTGSQSSSTNNNVSANQNLNGGAVDTSNTGSSTVSTPTAKPFTTTIKIVNGNNGETVNSAVVTYTPNSQGTAYSVSVNNPQLSKYINNIKVQNIQIEDYLQNKLNEMTTREDGKKVYNDFFFGDDKWQLTSTSQSSAQQDAVVTHDSNGNFVMTFTVYPKTQTTNNNNNNDSGNNIVVPIDDNSSSSNDKNSNNNSNNNNNTPSNNNNSNNDSSNGKVNDSQNKSVIQEAINERNEAQKALSTVDLKGKDITQVANLLKQHMKNGNIQILRNNRVGIVYSNAAGQQLYRYTVTFDSATGSLTWSPLINFATGQEADLAGIQNAEPTNYSNSKNTNDVDGKEASNKDGQNATNNSVNGFGTGANGNTLGGSSASDLAQTATSSDENSSSMIAVLGVSLLGTAGIMTLNKKKIY